MDAFHEQMLNENYLQLGQMVVREAFVYFSFYQQKSCNCNKEGRREWNIHCSMLDCLTKKSICYLSFRVKATTTTKPQPQSQVQCGRPWHALGLYTWYWFVLISAEIINYLYAVCHQFNFYDQAANSFILFQFENRKHWKHYFLVKCN